MALRLRRGTDAQRAIITPLDGELIYTTDTKITLRRRWIASWRQLNCWVSISIS